MIVFKKLEKLRKRHSQLISLGRWVESKLNESWSWEVERADKEVNQGIWNLKQKVILTNFLDYYLTFSKVPKQPIYFNNKDSIWIHEPDSEKISKALDKLHKKLEFLTFRSAVYNFGKIVGWYQKTEREENFPAYYMQGIYDRTGLDNLYTMKGYRMKNFYQEKFN